MLEAICCLAAEAIIGIGSSNKYDLRNPFTAEETEKMIQAYLAPRFSNFQMVRIPDFGHLPEYADGQMWKNYVIKTFGILDFFVSGNPYTSKLLQEDYKILHPKEIIPPEKYVSLRATKVRMEMANNSDCWKELVPVEVADYLIKSSLLERFQREFGEETLKSIKNNVDYRKIETMEEERQHAAEK